MKTIAFFTITILLFQLTVFQSLALSEENRANNIDPVALRDGISQSLKSTAIELDKMDEREILQNLEVSLKEIEEMKEAGKITEKAALASTQMLKILMQKEQKKELLLNSINKQLNALQTLDLSVFIAGIGLLGFSAVGITFLIAPNFMISLIKRGIPGVNVLATRGIILAAFVGFMLLIPIASSF